MPASSVGAEISHLMKTGPGSGPQKGRRMPQKQAVAVALSMKRRGKIRNGGKRRGRSR